MTGGRRDDDDWRPTPQPTIEKKQGGNGTGGGLQPDACNIVENTVLNSPNRSVIATLRTGDVLSIVLEPGPPQRLVAQHGSGDIAGSITSPSMLQIVQCIAQHNLKYVGEVLSVRGAVCQIRVRPA